MWFKQCFSGGRSKAKQDEEEFGKLKSSDEDTARDTIEMELSTPVLPVAEEQPVAPEPQEEIPTLGKDTKIDPSSSDPPSDSRPEAGGTRMGCPPDADAFAGSDDAPPNVANTDPSSPKDIDESVTSSRKSSKKSVKRQGSQAQSLPTISEQDIHLALDTKVEEKFGEQNFRVLSEMRNFRKCLV